jgi:hypothetical protein
MRLISYYRQIDPNLMRRVIGPLSVLSQRGHHASFSITMSPERIEVANYHIIILPNWAIDVSLPRAQGAYIYDLSDAALINDERVQFTLSQCQAVMVPTDTMATLVKPYCSRVGVVPSMVHADWFYSAQVKRPQVPMIACLGNYAWDQVGDALLDILKAEPEVKVVTNHPDFFRTLPVKQRLFIENSADAYPYVVRGSFLALFPGERREIDPGAIAEFNLYGAPVIAGPAWSAEVEHNVTGLVARSPQQWADHLLRLMADETLRRRLGNAAQASARAKTAVRMADSWLSSVSKLCPSSVVLPTLR